MSARFIGSEIYRASSYGPDHPLRIPRVSTVMDLSRALGWLPSGRYVASPRAKPAALETWHRPDYIAALRAAETAQEVSAATRDRYALGTAANPVYPEVFRRPATAAGGSMMAANLLQAPGRVFNPGGGTHHGMPGRANGFCYLNDPVLGILTLLRQGAQRVAYVDIDAHHCDGVAHAFAADPRVACISTHEEGRWPRTGALDERGAGNLWNLPLPRGSGDAAMAFARDAVILPVVAAHRPDAIVLQCGADAVLEDPLSGLAMSNNAHIAVLDGLRPLCERLMVLGGGGYNPWSVGRLWTRVWAALDGHDLPDRLPAPAEHVLRGLSFPGNRMGRNPPEPWFTTLADPPRPGTIPADLRARVDELAARARAWV
ncbi:acetoin utilization protein AcuC [Palleronia sediminis]|uniref:acetoin utilization protein AcuC n=1 Tax=Palleronia sediminis TaxID=2547833 RepID=UPI001F0FE7E6|nr:acetoin utilization protein AcuC [Palleronia sediminis]